MAERRRRTPIPTEEDKLKIAKALRDEGVEPPVHPPRPPTPPPPEREPEAVELGVVDEAGDAFNFDAEDATIPMGVWGAPPLPYGHAQQGNAQQGQAQQGNAQQGQAQQGNAQQGQGQGQGHPGAGQVPPAAAPQGAPQQPN